MIVTLNTPSLVYKMSRYPLEQKCTHRRETHPRTRAIPHPTQHPYQLILDTPIDK